MHQERRHRAQHPPESPSCEAGDEGKTRRWKRPCRCRFGDQRVWGVVVFVGLPLVLLLMMMGLASFEKRVLSVDDTARSEVRPAVILTVEDHTQSVSARETALAGITPGG